MTCWRVIVLERDLPRPGVLSYQFLDGLQADSRSTGTADDEEAESAIGIRELAAELGKVVTKHEPEAFHYGPLGLIG